VKYFPYEKVGENVPKAVLAVSLIASVCVLTGSLLIVDN
jgi:hypothetical protein